MILHRRPASSVIRHERNLPATIIHFSLCGSHAGRRLNVSVPSLKPFRRTNHQFVIWACAKTVFIPLLYKYVCTVFSNPLDVLQCAIKKYYQQFSMPINLSLGKLIPEFQQ
jgi:hypothetical protein